jgi:hypothetical protein
VLPPEATARNAAPLSILGEERDEWLGIATIQRLGCSTKLVYHSPSMAQFEEEDELRSMAATGRSDLDESAIATAEQPQTGNRRPSPPERRPTLRFPGSNPG